ncbi:hypothetical protein CPB84DRAFT_1673450, partial [Gymnopilus junonius]
KIMGFMADNVSNNDTLVAELANLVPGFSGLEYHVHCFAHILNLIIKVCSSISTCAATYFSMFRLSYHPSATNLKKALVLRTMKTLQGLTWRSRRS